MPKLPRWVWIALVSTVPFVILARKPFWSDTKNRPEETLLKIEPAGNQSGQRSRSEHIAQLQSDETLQAAMAFLGLEQRWQATSDEVLRRLRDHLTVNPGLEDNLISIRYAGSDVNESRVIARSIGKMYIKRIEEETLSRATAAIAEMEKALAEQAAQVDAARARMLALERESPEQNQGADPKTALPEMPDD